MKNSITTLIFLLATLVSQAQLKGSGVIKKQNFDFKNFNQVYLEDLDGQIEIKVGNTWNIDIEIDDNLLPLLKVGLEKSGKVLKVAFSNNKNNKRYIEDTHVKVKITLPQLLFIKHVGNSGVTISNLTGKDFEIDNQGNGSMKCSGTVDRIKIYKTGNGNIEAQNLIVNKASIQSLGNGNVTVNATAQLTASTCGNGYIKNSGKATFDKASSTSGNGKLIKS
jgi:hypothetical protein